MILHVLSYRNKVLRCYTTPNFTDVPLENCAIGAERSLLIATPEKASQMKDLDLYHIGDFNDEDGTFTPLDGGPVLLLNCGDVLAKYGK